MEDIKPYIEQIVREEANKAFASSHYVSRKFMEEFRKNLETGLSLVCNTEAADKVSDPEKDEQAYTIAVLKAASSRKKYKFPLDSIFEKELETLEAVQADPSLYKRKQPKTNDSEKDFDCFIQTVEEAANDLSTTVETLRELKNLTSKVSVAADIRSRLQKELEDEK